MQTTVSLMLLVSPEERIIGLEEILKSSELEEKIDATEAPLKP